ncbi:hypothetical protein NIES592_08025 [Fischerella major NIES-592]|uniref:Uncharacterized protein n=1 Tax=Fischerella major NIES-592 TaxID=210994 RepID=A0A1U7H1G5_9CYAN|nr:hypothetical protein [Fischerella major]OKH14814.1 hypothetical protein NIES592_08025 [Fischerella major NIES-592]
MTTSNITILKEDEAIKKQQLEESVIAGIESGKRGFQQATQALLRIDELGLWRDEAVSFDAYRQKFKAVLEDLDITDRHLNRLIAAEKCVQMLRPMGLNISQYKERQIRPLTQLKEPKQVQQAYKRALDIAQIKGEDLNYMHVQKAVEEIKPPKVRLPKPPRPPIGATVRILPHYPDEEFHGVEGVIIQHPSIDRCIVRFDDQTSKLIPDNMLVRVEEIREITSVKEENKLKARSLGLKTGLQALPDVERNEGMPTEAQQLETEMAIAAFLRILPKLSHQQKELIYEQLIKSSFVPSMQEVAA